MTLSAKSINGLADVLAEEVIDYIFSSQEWVEFMMEMIPAALHSKFDSSLDSNLMSELSMCIMDRILIKKSSL